MCLLETPTKANKIVVLQSVYFKKAQRVFCWVVLGFSGGLGWVCFVLFWVGFFFFQKGVKGTAVETNQKHTHCICSFMLDS